MRPAAALSIPRRVTPPAVHVVTTLAASLAATIAAALALAALPTRAGAQEGSHPQRQLQIEALADRARHTGDMSYGASADYQLVWGGKRALQLAAALGGDWARQASSGQQRWALDADVTVQHPVGSFTPFVGASAGPVWLRGGESSGGRAHLGLDAIVGTQVAIPHGGGRAVIVEVRHGYVKGEPHSTSGRLGLNLPL